jgi:hypothetical protein
VRLGPAWDDHVGSMAVGVAITGLQPLVMLETAIYLLSLPVALLGLYLLVRRSGYAPRYWFAYLATSSAYMLVDLLTTAFVMSQMERLLGSETVAVWTMYWARSRRVRATFGAAALDSTTAGSVAAPHSTPSAA